MSLARKLTKFSIIPFLVLALSSTELKAQEKYDSTPKSVGQLVEETDLKKAFRENVIYKNFLQDMSYEVSLSLKSPENSYLRPAFPAQYGMEFELSKRIPNTELNANAFFTSFKGNSHNQEIQRKINGSAIGIGLEYSKIFEWGVGMLHKTQNISGPKNGFPEYEQGLGFYLQAKKEIELSEDFSLSFRARYNKTKNIGDCELGIGLIFKPQQSSNSR